MNNLIITKKRLYTILKLQENRENDNFLQGTMEYLSGYILQEMLVQILYILFLLNSIEKKPIFKICIYF